MTRKLKELYSNYGLPENVLTSVAAVAINGLDDACTEEQLTERAKDSSVVDFLKSLQSHSDKIRTDALKAAKGKTKDVEDPETGGDGGKIPDYIQKLLDQQEKDRKELADRLAAIESSNKLKDFDSLVSRLANEMGIDSVVLDLVKPGLSSDMDESAIKDKLGAAKKALSERGATFREQLTQQTSEAELQAQREEALKWAKEHEVKDAE